MSSYDLGLYDLAGEYDSTFSPRQPTVPPWRFVVVNSADGSALGGLGAATARKVTWYLDAEATASFTLPGTHRQAALITETATDLVVYDSSGTKRFRGRLGSSGDDVSSAGHVSQFSAVDYRGMLGRRVIWPGAQRSWLATEQTDIAWGLIAGTQAQTGGDLGIERGTGGASGVTRDRNYAEGVNIGLTLLQLGDVTNGFDWEIDAGLCFNTFYPQRGTASGHVLTYGARVSSFRRVLDTTQFANAIRYSGATGVASATAVASSFGPAGRWESQVGDTSLLDADTVADKATWQLAQDIEIDPSYSLVLRPGWWTPDLLWLGDTARVVLRSGRLNVDTTQRITQIDLAPGDDGGEVVTLTVGPVVSNQHLRIRNALRRLATLETR